MPTLLQCSAAFASRTAGVQEPRWHWQQWRQHWREQRRTPAVGRQLRCRVAADMYVPSDSFGGLSPERRAAQSMQRFFTFVACKIIMSQLEGIGRGDLGGYDAEAISVLRHFMHNVPMTDANEWLAQLMQQDEMLGVRIMEVRAAYAKEDFEWQNLQRLAVEGLAEDNTRLLRQHASQRYSAMFSRSGEQ